MTPQRARRLMAAGCIAVLFVVLVVIVIVFFQVRGFGKKDPNG